MINSQGIIQKKREFFYPIRFISTKIRPIS
jgi:hypothetical protein